MTRTPEASIDSLLSELDPTDHLLERIERAIEPDAWNKFWYRPLLSVMGALVGASVPLGFYSLLQGMGVQGMSLLGLAVAVGYILSRELRWTLSDKQAALLMTQASRALSIQKLAVEHRKTGKIGYFEACRALKHAHLELPLNSSKIVMMPVATLSSARAG